MSKCCDNFNCGGDAAAEKPAGKLFVISGPSGVGKSTITSEVVSRSGATLSISATTRAPRGSEADGVDYYFVSTEEFRQMIDNDALLEWADVFGNYYGTPAGSVELAVEAGKTVILEIDVQGGVQVAKRCPEAKCILIVPPSDAELKRRLTGRGTDADEVIARRLAKSQQELEIARKSGVYKKEVVNDELEKAIDRVLEIISGD